MCFEKIVLGKKEYILPIIVLQYVEEVVREHSPDSPIPSASTFIHFFYVFTI